MAALRLDYFSRVEHFQPRVGRLFALWRATDLLHQAEQEARGLFIEAQTLDKATSDPHVSQFQSIVRNAHFVERATGQLQQLAIRADGVASQ